MCSAILTLTLAAFATSPLFPQTNPPSDIKVYFSPHGGCTEAVVESVHAARRSVLVEAYSFTSDPIAVALIDAEMRGVDVEVILDKSQEQARGSKADQISENGIPTYIDAAYRIAHDKVMIIDGGTVLTGSFNFTKAAQERNAENLLVIRDAGIAAKYEGNWREHAGHSEPFRERRHY